MFQGTEWNCADANVALKRLVAVAQGDSDTAVVIVRLFMTIVVGDFRNERVETYPATVVTITCLQAMLVPYPLRGRPIKGPLMWK